MEETFTLTDLIEASQEYTLNSKENTLWLGMQGWGDSVDLWRDEWNDWEEVDMILQDFYPLEEDTSEEEIMEFYKDETNFRFHPYKCYMQFTLALPPNRRMGDRYTASQIREMITSSDSWGDDTPKGGFTTYGNRSWSGELLED